jgi:hypothetical protein
MCHGKNNLLHVKFGNTDNQMVNTPLNIQAWGLHTPQKGAIAHCCMMEQGSA